MRSSGLYASSFIIKSMHSGEACGISFWIPVPSVSGKSKEMCCDECLFWFYYIAIGLVEEEDKKEIELIILIKNECLLFHFR